MNWSRWSRCESSFELLLVPSQPGVFALAEEVVQGVGPESRRMLAVFEVAEAEDLSRAMSRLFAGGSPWKEKMAQARIYVRYAIAPSTADRRAAATALKNWLSAQREVASQIFEKPTMGAQQNAAAAAEANWVPAMAAVAEPQAGGLKTVAERAVDRVTHGIKVGKAISAGS
ncbi:MAG TPA: hypothetical protein VLA83_02995 [Candidatus Binatia bacterium]|nr:hypothetical protein [Candidatus Binatia bacterium]